MLDGLHFGCKRNYGYGITRLKDMQVVDLANLDYSRLEDREAFAVEVTTPFVGVGVPQGRRPRRPVVVERELTKFP